jgi:membrane protease YdiL (CAAX protease family)
MIESFFHILILTPLLIWGRQSNKSADLKAILYVVMFYALTNLLLDSFSGVTVFQGQQWNWVGKGVALVAGVLFVSFLPNFNRTLFGITTQMNWAESKPILMFCGIYFMIRIGLYASSADASLSMHLETALYQATLPGLQEELLFRGILLGLLNSIFVLPHFRLLNVHFGLASVITSILFGLTHGMNFSRPFAFDINYFVFFRTAFDGFLFALLAEKTRSIFPSVIFHNLLNLIGQH